MKLATAQFAIVCAVIFRLTIGVIPTLATNQIIDGAVARGVSSETIALLLLLPLVATIVSVMHYVIGVSGYGIFMPTMMAVVMASMGVGEGLVLFASILAISLLSNLVLKKLKLHFWPARSMGLMMISVVVFGLMVILKNISIYPVLFMILLAEEFTRTQLAKSKKEAMALTVGTVVLAMVGAMALRAPGVQQLVLGYPEATILIVVVVNIIVGSYKGIRLTEIKRFKNAIRKK